MTSLNDLYRKFGEVAVAAQLLETQLGNMLLETECIEAGLLETPDAERATSIYNQVNRHTLGRMIRKLIGKDNSIAELEELLAEALSERNRLFHSFYMKHNFRRNSEEGRAIMIKELDVMHEKLLDAYKAIMLLSGVDLDKEVEERGDEPLPTNHLRL